MLARMLFNLGWAGFLVMGTLPFSPDPGALKKKYDTIKNGMTIEQVEKIFGQPSPCICWFHLGTSQQRQWSDDDMCATIYFRGNVVVGKQMWVIPFWDRVQYRLSELVPGVLD